MFALNWKRQSHIQTKPIPKKEFFISGLHVYSAFYEERRNTADYCPWMALLSAVEKKSIYIKSHSYCIFG